MSGPTDRNQSKKERKKILITVKLYSNINLSL